MRGHKPLVSCILKMLVRHAPTTLTCCDLAEKLQERRVFVRYVSVMTPSRVWVVLSDLRDEGRVMRKRVGLDTAWGYTLTPGAWLEAQERQVEEE